MLVVPSECMCDSGVTRALIWGGGGGCIFIYPCSARRISFEMNLISKEIRRAEHEYMNIHPPPPQINALVTRLHVSTPGKRKSCLAAMRFDQRSLVC